MTLPLAVLLSLALAAPAVAQAPEGPNPDAHYQLGPDSLAQDGVPKGRIHGPFVIQSEAFPGTQHTYWVYVPAQYDPARPASLMVFNDGQAYMHPDADLRAHNVMDNLIHRREIPVLLGVFINPGRRPDQEEARIDSWGDGHTNRPEEYNSVDDRYPRVIVDELLPALRKDYNVSGDPEQRGIAGSSSGAIAAFTVAWFRPNEFRKVISFIGTFVNLAGRGGNKYPDMILADAKKPLRVFLQDGRNDNRGVRPNSPEYIQERDWFYNNVRMAKALTGKGYDVNYTWGIGRHSQKQPGAVLPEAMRWLWRDHVVSTDPNDTVERSFNAPAAP
jgi:enterochelin esterase family protein